MKASPEQGKADAGQDGGGYLPKRPDLKGTARLMPMIIATWNPRGVEGGIITKSGLGNFSPVDFSQPRGAKAFDRLARNFLKKPPTGRKLKVIP